MFSRDRFPLFGFALAMPLFVLLTGCGNDDIGPLYPVKGRVLQNQQPVKITAGYVVLKPDAAKGNQTEFEPAGTIDADGNFVLYTKQRSGAPPGWYKVIVTATGEPAAIEKGQSSRPIAKSLVSLKYSKAETTPLSIEVVESPAEGAYDLEVTD